MIRRNRQKQDNDSRGITYGTKFAETIFGMWIDPFDRPGGKESKYELRGVKRNIPATKDNENEVPRSQTTRANEVPEDFSKQTRKSAETGTSEVPTNDGIAQRSQLSNHNTIELRYRVHEGPQGC